MNVESIYEGWSICNEKIRDANDYGQIHFTVFQYNPLQAQCTFPIDVLASLHRPGRTVCLAVRTSHLSCRWPLHHSHSVHEANLSKIGTRGSQTEPGWWIRRLTEQFEAAFSNCSHCHGRSVGRCIVLMKQHTVTRLSAAFLLDSRPKFPEQFSVVNTGKSCLSPGSQSSVHPHYPRIPTPWFCQQRQSCETLLASAKWHASIACSAAWSRDRSDEPKSRPWWHICGETALYLRFTDWNCHVKWPDRLAFYPASAFAAPIEHTPCWTQRVDDNMMGCTVW